MSRFANRQVRRWAVGVLGVAGAMPGAWAGQAGGAAQVEVTGQGSALIGSVEYAALRGEYLLANGSRLVVEGSRQRLVVSVDEQAPQRLVMSSPQDFVSADGRWRLRFQARPNGLVDGVQVTGPLPAP